MPVVHNTDRTSPQLALRWLEEHGDALYACAMARVRDSHVAEDLVQETLVAGLTSADTFLGQSAERSWLIGILRHKLVDHLRRAVRERPLSQMPADATADWFDHRGHWKEAPKKWNADPHVLAETAEFRDVLAQCLSRLPSRMAQLFWLR